MKYIIVASDEPYIRKHVDDLLRHINQDVIAIVKVNHKLNIKNILLAMTIYSFKQKLNMFSNSLMSISKKYSIPFHKVDHVNSEYFISLLNNYNPDIVIYKAHQIVKEELVQKYFFLSSHGSLLPKYRGGFSIFWQFMNDDQEFGMSIMRLDKGLDTGNVLSQESYIRNPGENLPFVYQKIFDLATIQILKTLKSIEDKKVMPIKLKGEPSFYKSPKIKDIIRFWFRKKRIIPKPVPSKSIPKKSLKVKIKNYEKKYEPDIRRLCVDTAFFGNSFQAFIEDPNIYADFATDLLNYFPESCFVATVRDKRDNGGEKVVGYLIGCLDSRKYYTQLKSQTNRLLLKKFLTGRYKITFRTLRYLFLSALHLFFKAIDRPYEYPANLHIGIDMNYRSLGIGRKLMDSFHRYVKDSNIDKIHINTTTGHQAAIKFYEKLGYKIHNNKKSFLWSKMAKRRIDDVIYVKDLNE
ncbi:MAG: GNAT family N-acetyltransferase [Candidatus Woesearchaeota archaeon]